MGYNPPSLFKRGITYKMQVQSHSILIMCQACRFFLKAGRDRQKKDFQRKSGEASNKVEH